MKRFLKLVYFMSLSLFVIIGEDSYGQSPTEYEVKAAFLYNFAKFVEWPGENSADSSESIIIGVLGKDQFGSDLDRTIQGKSVQNRKLIVKHFSREDNYQDCHIIFISSSEKKHLKEIFDRLMDRPVLTVGEMDNFVSRGGIINFVMQENKVRFQINIDAARNAGLRLSSKLIRVSIIVRNGES